MTAVFHVGDAIEVMSKLPEKSVDLILTSPPFLALRSYLPADHPDKAKEGGSQSTPGEFIDWLLDVAEACDRVLAPHGSLCIELGDTYAGSGGAGGDYNEDGLRKGQPKFRQGYFDPARGRAPRAAEDYAADSYVSAKGGTGWPLAKSLSLIPESFRFAMVYGRNPHTGRTIEPWRLRNVIRWVRPNPPVGALGDKFRPATSELMVFCKSARRYFDLDAVREPHKTGDHHLKFPDDKYFGQGKGSADHRGERQAPIHPAGAPPLDWWNIPLLEGEEETRYGPKQRVTHPEPNPNPKRKAERDLGVGGNGWLAEGDYHQRGGAPPLDWWNIPPGGYEGAHYAVFPPELCVKPVKAMCPEKVCRVCGEPSRRVSEAGIARLSGAVLREAREAAGLTRAEVGAWWGGGANNVWDYEEGGHVPPRDRWDQLKAGLGIGDEHDYLIPEAVAYEYVNNDSGGLTQNANGDLYRRVTSRQNRIAPDRFTDCGHDDWRPGLVLDPFAGSGTTLAVATGHGRDAIGIDLDARNFDLALERVGPFILERAG